MSGYSQRIQVFINKRAFEPDPTVTPRVCSIRNIAYKLPRVNETAATAPQLVVTPLAAEGPLPGDNVVNQVIVQYLGADLMQGICLGASAEQHEQFSFTLLRI